MAKGKRTERERTVDVSPEQVNAYAKSAERLASTMVSLAKAIELDGFSRPVGVAGAHLIDESFVKLHRLIHKMAGNFYGAMTVLPKPDSIPESVPESGQNTRNGAAESRTLPEPEQPTKHKKSP